jgi:uncharacterized protein (TIGR00251 family)
MLLNIKVTPKSSKNELVKQSDGSYKAKLSAAPTEGKANESLIKILSEEFGVPKTKIKIVRGLTSRNKVIEIGD